MRLDDLPEDASIEDRREEGGYVGGGRGGFGMPMGAGGLSIGTVLVLGIIGYALGIDPSVLIGGAEMLSRGQPQVQSQQNPQRRTSRPTDEMGRFVNRILSSNNAEWRQILAKNGVTYHAPTLVLYRGRTDAPCGGVASKAMGPFYCPADRKIYLDTSFFNELETRFGSCSGRNCQFAEAYVIAHEVGHHVQNELGILSKATRAQHAAAGRAQANAIQVRVELQADCLAGLWAKRENESLQAQGKPAFVDQKDIESALRTAAAIGDDTLQKRARGYAVPDSFTHGTSQQRQHWFDTGFTQGTVASCNTFGASNL
jgi:predicted metalloprotease